MSRKLQTAAVFNSSERENNNFLCGIGTCIIHEGEVSISNYPFEPSVAYPKKTFSYNEIQSVCVEYGECKIFVGDDIVFMSAEHKENLRKFAERHNIIQSKYSWNWDWILEPYLDTDLSDEGDKQILERLAERGFEPAEVFKIREEVGKQMHKYNFDTMLWEWTSLSLLDVLSAMRVKYDKHSFKDFYNRAISIEKTGNNF